MVEPALMVVGLNHRTASLAVRERFWIGENQCYAALRQLKKAEGIEEIVVLSTLCRTEFLIWASDPATKSFKIKCLPLFINPSHRASIQKIDDFRSA